MYLYENTYLFGLARLQRFEILVYLCEVPEVNFIRLICIYQHIHHHRNQYFDSTYSLLTSFLTFYKASNAGSEIANKNKIYSFHYQENKIYESNIIKTYRQRRDQIIRIQIIPVFDGFFLKQLPPALSYRCNYDRG